MEGAGEIIIVKKAMAVGQSRRPPTSALRLDAGEVDFQDTLKFAAPGQGASFAEADEADRFGGGHLSLSSLDRRENAASSGGDFGGGAASYIAVYSRRFESCRR
ncbi:hypothetical protein D3C80_1262410 [compost metagenome]